jgi:mono/diheme cytochrome c family protein
MRRDVKRAVLALLAATVAAAVAAFWLSRPRPLADLALPQQDPDPRNGEQLFHAGGCASCHGVGLAGGLEIVTAFGTFRVPNITPDREAGIGGWTTLDFLNAMKRGVAPDGRHYYPAFPYTSYTRMSVADLADLKAYLDTFAPARASVADHELHFPWNIRRGVGLWKLRYLDDQPVVPMAQGGAAGGAQVDARLERGRYLVESVGHCGECHTPRDRCGGLDRSRWLAGAPSIESGPDSGPDSGPGGEDRVPNITPHEDGLAGWSARDIARFLKSGFTPDYDMVGGAMVEVQENLARLSDSDRDAIAAYLGAVPAVPGTR